MTATRRDFLRQTVAAGAIATLPFSWTMKRSRAANVNSGLTVAAIGVGGSRGAYSQGRAIAHRAAQHARMIAVCDVDALHMAEFNAQFDNKLKQYPDYRTLLEREKPDIVTIGTPDHWHVPIAVAAMRAGCDVYCEKPLTLTIEEGFIIRDAVKESGRVFQVGTQQRSENDQMFLKAIAIVQSGRLGSRVKAYAAIGGAPVDGPFPEAPPPNDLDWDMWIGPAQRAGYSLERRKEFRWFYDYSGGKLTDWGAHHIDIAQWALGHDHSGPVKIRGTGEFAPFVPDHFDWHAYLEGRASLPNGYHTPSRFGVDCEFADGAVLHVCDSYDRGDGKTQFGNGILFEGEEGRIFVNRERLTGRPVEEMTDAERQKISGIVIELYKGQQPGDHMRNFFEAVHSRGVPIGDVETHHRSMTTCHLCNIALMLGRELEWNPKKEQFDGDDEATMLMSRPRRDKFSWEATT